MIDHNKLHIEGFTGKRKLLKLIRKQTITLAGNKHLKIYGTLVCSSGKRMKVANRIFFANEKEAIAAGYRPCGHCMRKQYLHWKKVNG
jgi:methylphosphotriester-DNA--protein-cysteine methyltransferase